MSLDDIKVSAVLSTFNRFPSLLQAIASVKAQTHPNLEIIVVNDGSTDVRYSRERPEGVTWIDLPRSSRALYGFPCLAHVRNVGIAQATGEYVAFLDDDDCWMPDKLRKQLQALADSGAELCATEGLWGGLSSIVGNGRAPLYHAEHFRGFCRTFARQHPEHGMPDGELPDRFELAFIRGHNFMIHSSVMVRRSLLDKVRGYRLLPLHGITVNGELQVEDWDLWKRCLERSDCVYLKEPLTYLRPPLAPQPITARSRLGLHFARPHKSIHRFIKRAGSWLESPPTRKPYDLRRHCHPALKLLHRLQDGLRPAPPTGKMPILIDAKPCIFMAWTRDNPLHGYLQLCLESVRKHNHEHFNIIVLTPQNIGDYLQDLHPAYQYLSYPHRADYLRCQVLHRYGGVYLDMDTICFKSLKPFYEKLHDYDIVNYDGRPWDQLFGISVFGPTRRESDLTAAWSARLAAHLDRRHEDLIAYRQIEASPRSDCLEWTEILDEIVTPLAKELDQKNRLSFYRISLQHLAPIGQLCSRSELLSPGRLRAPANAALMILNNNSYPDELKRLSRQEILQKDLGITSLIRQAISDRAP